MSKDKSHLFEQSTHRLLPFDHLTIAYCWIIIILTFNFGRPIGNFPGLLAFHIGAIILAGCLAHFGRSKTNRFVVFFRLLYPLILMTFFYQFSGKLANSIIPHFLDGQVVGMEKSIIGINLTLWLDNRLSLIMTELMAAAYFSYYFMIPGMAIVLFIGRRDDEIKMFVTATCATFFFSYLMFIFYPVAGPRYHFAELYQNEISGLYLRDLVDFVITNAAFKGGAMPSSHVAEAVVVMLFAIRNYRRKAYFMVPVVLALSMGTVYGRFHYVSDVIVGIVIGVVAVWMTLQYYPARKEINEIQRGSSDKKRIYVSDSV